MRRTRRRLKEALLELIEERDYARITIRDITSRADVGRSTFYSHYASKEDLLFSGFDGWLRSVAEAAPAERPGDPGPGGELDDPRRPRFRFSLPLLRHASTQKRFFEAAIVRGSNARIRRKTTALVAEVVRLELDRTDAASAGDRARGMRGMSAGRTSVVRDGASDGVREAEAHAIAGAFLGILTWWLADGRGLSAEVVDEVFQGFGRSGSPVVRTGARA